MSVVLAFDQGTTSSRSIVFDQSGSILGVAQREFAQHYPQPGWVEHDANEIWESQLIVAREVLEQCGLSASDVAGIGITNQRETDAALGSERLANRCTTRSSGQDRRTASYCDSLIEAGHNDLVQQKSGLLIDSYFCAPKLHWLLENVPGARERAERGELAFGTIDSWLLWKLSGGGVHATDVTNASRTMLLNIATCEWDDELLKLFQYSTINLAGSATIEPHLRRNRGQDFRSTNQTGRRSG